MDEENKVVIQLVETPQGCFISDYVKTNGYYYEYPCPRIVDLYFDGEKAKPTFAKNWVRISQYPKIVERMADGVATNRRYELKEVDIASEKLPLVIKAEDVRNYSSDIIETLYNPKSDILPPTKELVDVDIQVVLKMEEYVEPSLSYEAIGRFDYGDKTYTITSANLRHQLFDQMIFPEICLAHRPCSLSSREVYDITRQYVLSHIDSSAAKVTSNYDFCFTVKKIVPKIAPETITYHNIFARTKKERNKVKTSVQTYTEYEIFQMTHNQSNYQGYTAIPAIFANNEAELQVKMDEWLSTLIEIINTPLQECPHCKGTGLLGEVQRVNHKVLSEISAKGATKS